MLDDKDVQKLLEVFATRADLREAVSDLSTKEDVNNLLGALDAYAQKADSYMQETVMLGQQLNRHERWIEELAAKVGHRLKS
jgi:hypothetical protein